jgi:hypothetical protein
MAAPAWTAEKITALDTDKIKNLMGNALKGKRQDIADLCETELFSRMKNGKPETRVSQFHFICDPERSVTDNDNGTFWCGYFDIAKGHFANSVNFNTQVALHTSQKTPSYKQGKITRWEESAEGHIRFLVKPSDAPMDWVGEGDGDTGYKWVVVR